MPRRKTVGSIRGDQAERHNKQLEVLEVDRVVVQALEMEDRRAGLVEVVDREEVGVVVLEGEWELLMM